MISDARSQKIEITDMLRDLIIEERLASRKSAAQVAAALDRSQSWVAQIENGRKQKVNAKELISLFVEILNCSRDEAITYLEKSYFTKTTEPDPVSDPSDQHLAHSLQSFCDTVFEEYQKSDSIRKQTLLTALEEMSDCFFDFFMKELPEEIDVKTLSTDEYNRLLLSKPLVGGVYRVPITYLSEIKGELDQYDHQDSILCGVIDNSIHKPGIKESIIIPILPAPTKDYSKTHYTFRLFGSKYIAIGELCTTLGNHALQELIAFSSIEEFSSMLAVIYRHSSESILPANPVELIKQLKPYFNHIFNHQKLLLRM